MTTVRRDVRIPNGEVDNPGGMAASFPGPLTFPKGKQGFPQTPEDFTAVPASFPLGKRVFFRGSPASP